MYSKSRICQVDDICVIPNVRAQMVYMLLASAVLYLIALLNLYVLGFLVVFPDRAKRTQQGNLLAALGLLGVSLSLGTSLFACRSEKGVS